MPARGYDRDCFAGAPYIPSYMDLSNGPEPCVVCGDAATGLHYRCMTCEGCKGFFRRTIQKNLVYFCKGNNQCPVDKTNRNQCQQCRYNKCVEVGMATDLVLNDSQRLAKRQLIEENRERRKLETIRAQLCSTTAGDHTSDQDRYLIGEITGSYCQILDVEKLPFPLERLQSGNLRDEWERVIAPHVSRIIKFAQRIPPFASLELRDQSVLLHCCWLEILMLLICVQFDETEKVLLLPSGRQVTLANLKPTDLLLRTIFDYAHAFSKLQPDSTETALVAAVLLLCPDRPGLYDRLAVESAQDEVFINAAKPELYDRLAVESAQDEVLTALKRYLRDHFENEPVRWPKLLLKIADLRAMILANQAELMKLENTTLLAEILGLVSTLA